MRPERQYIAIWLILLMVVGVTFVLQLLVGSYPISFTEFMHVFSTMDPGAKTILFEARLPAAIAATVGGAALSIGGLQMQTYFKNPVAGPFELGISSGASLGVAVFIMLTGVFGYTTHNEWGIIISSSIGAVGIFIVVMIISYRLNSAVSMLIIGLMIASFINSIIDAIQTMATADSIKSYIFWSMGSFRNITMEQTPVMTFIVLIAMLISISLVKPLNLLLTGEEYARLTGLNVNRSRLLIVISTCLLTGSVTAFCGPIGFIGLAVPHAARGIFKTSDHKILLPAVILIGAIVSGACNLLTAIPIHGLVLPVNTFTSLVGAPFVIWIVLRGRALR
ncbi:MAG: iron transporter permease [Bacteroidetes bacterium]|nr:iron transporter permease [Bacteroidota bacterium]